MKKIQILYIGLLLVSFATINVVRAQKTEFLTKGKIRFEKRANIYGIMQQFLKGETGNWADNFKDYIKKNNKQFLVTQYDLYFDGDRTLYKNIPDDDNKQNMWFLYNDEDNIDYSDFSKSENIRQKRAFEEFFVLTDSTRKIDWKITNETREIAGISCRRANAIVMDSIYVVAFYTDAIITPGGPVSFNGLPGMILGVALPYDHVTWFATKVETDANAGKTISIPTKGKKITQKEYIEAILPAVKDWGNQGKMMIKSSLY